MPVFEDNEEIVGPKPDVIQAFDPGLKTAIIDTRYTPQSDLLAYISGRTWVVDYYSKVIDKNDEMTGQDTTIPDPLMQYRRIWSMELKVQQDLTQPSQDGTSNEMTLQGSAHVYPFLVPQEGDMFTAGVADGRLGIFKVTKVTRFQMFTESVHSIEYELLAMNDPVRIQDLTNKTIVTFYFVKDFLLNLQNPLLIKEDYESSKELEVYYYDLIKMYMLQFHSKEHMTLIVPDQSTIIYDHGLVDFVKTIMESNDDVHIQAIRQLNIADDGAMNSPSLWTMLVDQSPRMMKYAYKKTGLITRQAFNGSGLLGNFRYTGITLVVYPYAPTLGVDYHNGSAREKAITVEQIVSNWQAPPRPAPDSENGIVPMAPVKPVNMAESYVLSTAFYERTAGEYSLLEKLLLDYLDNLSVAAEDVLKLCEDSYTWGNVERFYYIPLVIGLIRYNLRRL